MRVKGVDQQEPVIVAMMRFNPIGRMAQRFRRREIRFALEPLPVAGILGGKLPIMLPFNRRAEIGSPRVGFLPADKVPGIETAW